MTYMGAARVLDIHQVETAFAEKDGGGFKFDRMGFERAVNGKDVLILEDISSTGDTTKATCEVTTAAGGNVIGASLIWKRGDFTAEHLGVPTLNALVDERVQTWKISDNPPGWGELPLVGDVGHPEYYEDYPGERTYLL